MDRLLLDPIGAAVLAVVVVVGVLGWKWLFGRNRRPPQKAFRCARCSRIEAYSARTIEAWRAGKTKLFCRSCHARWLETQPASRRASVSPRSGCLGILLLATLIPMLAIVSFYYAYRSA